MSLNTFTSQLPVIDSKDLTLGEMLGEGSFGTVYQATWNYKKVAVKILKLQKLNEDQLLDFIQEAKLMGQCRFENIVNLFGICLEQGKYGLLMEHLPKGSLYNILQNKKVEALPWNTRLQIATESGMGLTYLHSQKIIHRNLKSLNILLDNDYHAKISDFGQSKLKLLTSSTTKTSTTRWKSPESFCRGFKASEASDVYSYGMILWEIASRQIPFSDAIDETTVGIWIGKGEKEVIPEDTPRAYAKIVQLCWQEHKDRPTASKVVEMLQEASSKLLLISDAADETTAALRISNGEKEAIPEDTPKAYIPAQLCFQELKDLPTAFKVVEMLQEASPKLPLKVEQPVKQPSLASETFLPKLETTSMSIEKIYKKKWQATPSVLTFKGHESVVQTLIELKDGTLASCSWDNSVKLWDRKGNCLNTFKGHGDAIRRLLKLKDGTLASSSDDCTIKLWDLKGNCLNTFKGHEITVYTLIEMRDGTLLSGSMDGIIKLWDRKGNCLNTFKGLEDSSMILIELKDGTLASGSWQTIKLFDLKGNCLNTIKGEDFIYSFIELKDGTLAIGSYQTIKLLDRKGNCLNIFKGHEGHVLTLLELKDGTLASSGRKTIKLWDRKGNCLNTIKGHKFAVYTLIELKDGTLVSGSWDKTIKLWTFPDLTQV